ncbi:transcription termination factor 1a, mitochondrial-like [Ptychodera flava]|uniref:transcription termination factor 1a, mitochondrial-like n=1 Tax=Ptychodera flava TaxID=63121 RepID=UPI00396A4B36
MMKTVVKQLLFQSHGRKLQSTAIAFCPWEVARLRTKQQTVLSVRHLSTIHAGVFHGNIQSKTVYYHKCHFSNSLNCLFTKQQFLLNPSDRDFLQSIGVNLHKVPSISVNESALSSVKKLVQFLQDNEIPDHDIVAVIQKYPRIAFVRPLELQDRFQMLYDVGMHRDDVNKLFIRAPSVFSRFKTSTHFQDFIEFLQEVGLPNMHIMRIIQRSPLLLNRVKHIQGIVQHFRDLFQKHGCEEEFPRRIKYLLVQDPLIFIQSLQVIQEKLDFLSSLGIHGKDQIRVICNCPNALRTSDDYKLKVMDFIKHKLNLSQQELINLIIFYPQLLYFSTEKLEKNISFLYSEGFTAKDIIGKPAVLTRSPQLLQKRCRELKEVKFDFSSLHIFLVKPEKYQARLERLRDVEQKASSQDVENT